MRLDERLPTFDFDVLWEDYYESQCEIIVLNQREISVLFSCLRVASWVARWFAGSVLLSQLGRWADIETALTFIGTLERKLLMTGCLEGLIQTLEEIRDAVRAQAACCQAGLNSTNQVEYEGGLVYGTEEPLDKPSVFGPEEEFATEEEFLEHLCAAANNIVSGLILSLNNWSILSLGSLVAGGIVVGIVVANPPLAVLLALAGLAFAFTLFATIATYIGEHREDWVCAIYGASSYANLLVRIDALVSDLVIDLELGPFEVPLTELIHAVLDTDTINKAYQAIDLPPPIDPVECDSCSVCDEINVIAAASYEKTGDDTYEFLAEDKGTFFQIRFRVNWESATGVPCGPEKKITGSTLSVWSKSEVATNDFVVKDEDGNVLAADPDDITEIYDVCGYDFEIVSDTQCTAILVMPDCTE